MMTYRDYFIIFSFSYVNNFAETPLDTVLAIWSSYNHPAAYFLWLHSEFYLVESAIKAKDSVNATTAHLRQDEMVVTLYVNFLSEGIFLMRRTIVSLLALLCSTRHILRKEMGFTARGAATRRCCNKGWRGAVFAIVKLEWNRGYNANESLLFFIWGIFIDVGNCLKNRLVQHFGYAFNYDTNNIDKTASLDDDIPDVFLPVLQRLVDNDYLNVLPDQLTVNQYIPGHG